MLSIAIIEDDDAQRTELVRQLTHLLDRARVPAELHPYASGEAFLADRPGAPCQLAFLDIYLEGMDGIQTAQRLRETDPDCALVFLTSSADHAVEGFRLRAFHYLLKPWSPEDLSQVLEEFLKKHYKGQRFLDLPMGRTTARLPLEALLWAEHYQHQMCLHLREGGEVTVRISFRDFAALLADDPRFFLCSQGSLVDLDGVMDFDGAAFHMSDGHLVPVSRSLRRSAKEALSLRLFDRLLEP